MRIVADENILSVKDAFSQFGEVIALPSGEIKAENVKKADILLVRSATKVGPRLLEGSQVKFVGTASIGFDHINLGYLKQQKIGFARAPGSNANSVAEYVVSALFEAAARLGFRLTEKTVGIIGCGHIGSNLLKKFQTLGVSCLVNDPPLKDQTGDSLFVELDEIFAADILTLHVPLVKDVPYPTFHMVNSAFLRRMKKHAVLVNTSRGSVVDEAALKLALEAGEIAAVLDVWENEPSLDFGLVSLAKIATAHIAGYSYDGKRRGTQMIHEAVCRFFGEVPLWSPTPGLKASKRIAITEQDIVLGEEHCLRKAVLAGYDIREDDRNMRIEHPSITDKQAEYFSSLRKHYRVRREFPYTHVQLPSPQPSLAAKLSGLGFRVA